MHRILIIAVALGLTVSCAANASGKEPEPGSEDRAKEWLRRCAEKVTKCRTLGFDATVLVLEAPAASDQERIHPFVPGTLENRFRIKGKNRLNWRESASGKVLREAWFEGCTLQMRTAKSPDKLIPLEVGEGEGQCVRMSVLVGGVLGWRLCHGMDQEMSGSAYVAPLAVRWVGEEKLDGRPAVVVDLDLGFGFGPERARVKSGSTRLWIDRDRLVPLRHETSLRADKEDESGVIRVREGYSGWIVDEPIPDEEFHVEGMPASDPLVDAPEDPAEFEEAQTRKFLGFQPKRLPDGSEPIGEDAPRIRYVGFGPKPVKWKNDRNKAIAADGSVVEVRCTREPGAIAEGTPFVSTRTNRRHLYGFGSFNPSDAWIVTRVEGKPRAALFFRDVGSHDTAPAPCAIAVDSKGRCHLAVADVDIGQNNRLKLLWLVGDLDSGKWEEAYIVDHREEFTSWSHPVMAAAGDTVHLAWSFIRDADQAGPDTSGVHHVTKTPEGFGKKVRVAKGRPSCLDLAVDPKSGRAFLVFDGGDGIHGATLPVAGRWTAPTRLHPRTLKRTPEDIRVEARGDEKFAVRFLDQGRGMEWIFDFD